MTDPREMFYPNSEKGPHRTDRARDVIFPLAIRMNPPTSYPY